MLDRNTCNRVSGSSPHGIVANMLDYEFELQSRCLRSISVGYSREKYEPSYAFH